MKFHCEICDKLMDEPFKNKHIISESHKHLVLSNIMRYIRSNPESIQIDKILGKYIINQRYKYHQFEFILLLKLLKPSNQVEYIRFKSSDQNFEI